MSQISFFDGSVKFKIDKPVRLIELFSGIGSQAKALTNIGIPFEHYFICEFDKYAVTAYNAIHGTEFEPTDITKITANDLNIHATAEHCYILSYSFPCQDLSKAGKGKGMEKGSNTRSGLLWEVERLLNERKDLPQVLLMENVPDVIGTGNMPQFAKWLEALERLGYKNYYECLNAKHYGVAQNRDRCFMISILGDYYYEFPEPFPLEKRLFHYLDEVAPQKWTLNQTQIYNLKNSKFNQDAERINLPHDICNTLCARDYKNPQCIEFEALTRRIIPGEYWRLMDFTDADFHKAKQALNDTYYKGKDRSNSQLYKQAGNSIVVGVLEQIFKQMMGGNYEK